MISHKIRDILFWIPFNRIAFSFRIRECKKLSWIIVLVKYLLYTVVVKFVSERHRVLPVTQSSPIGWCAMNNYVIAWLVGLCKLFKLQLTTAQNTNRKNKCSKYINQTIWFGTKTYHFKYEFRATFLCAKTTLRSVLALVTGTRILHLMSSVFKIIWTSCTAC